VDTNDQSSRPARQRPGGRSARVRAAVLAATLEVLAEMGYDDVSVEAIAARAGVHKTTVYRGWPTKADLVSDAIRERGARLVPIPDSGNFRDDLIALAQAVANTMRSPADQRMGRNLVAASNSGEGLDQRSVSFWAERLQLNGHVVDRAIARGELPPDTDSNLVIETLIGPLFLRLLLTGEPIDADVASAIARLVAAGAAALGATKA
jgi:AcrR family transcriptional regulator